MREREPVDFLILAPLKEEIAGLCQALGLNPKSLQPENLTNSIKCHRTSLCGNNSQELKVAIVQLSRQGILNAAVETCSVLLDIDPWCVVTFGIAGGFVSDELSLHDVVFGDVVYYYEPSKETSRNISRKNPETVEKENVCQSRNKPFSASKTLEVLTRRLESMADFRLRFGPVASGEKLIADIDSQARTTILNINSKTMAVEMEAAGVAAAISWFAPLESLQFIVIKGISDDATTEKNTKTENEIIKDRALAVKHASIVLKSIICNSQPQRLKETANGNVETVKELTKRINESLPVFIMNEVDQDSFENWLYSTENHFPKVYYHWRQLHPKLNWVDFFFLRTLACLRELGLHPRALITDNQDAKLSTQTKDQLTKIIQAMLHEVPVYYSEASRNRGDYITFAMNHGFDHAVLDSIQSAFDTHHLQKGNLATQDWLQYIAWDSRSVKKCIVFVWAGHYEIYKHLFKVLPLDPLLIKTGDIRLGGSLGKFDYPGKTILIDPPSYPEIVKWIHGNPPIDLLNDFLEYVSVYDLPNNPEDVFQNAQNFITSQLSSDCSSWLEKVDNRDYKNAILKVFALLNIWNGKFFSEVN